MNVFITGAAGMIGLSAGEAMSNAGWRVSGCDLRPTSKASFPIEQIDLLSGEAWAKRLVGVDALIHLAGHADFGRVPDERLYAENVALTERVFAAALAAGVRKLIFASSCQVCSGLDQRGPHAAKVLPAYLPLDGAAPARPANAYARSKLAGEESLRALAAAHADLAAVAVRFPWVVPMERMAEATWLRTALQLQRDAFAFLPLEEAGRLLVAIARAPLQGYRCYCPAARENLLLRPAESVRRRYFVAVPCRVPTPLESLVDLTMLTQETGWAPAPLTWLRGFRGAWRKNRVLTVNALAQRWPTARRRAREVGAKLRQVFTSKPSRLGRAELIFDARAELGESAWWDERRERLLWVDAFGHKAHATDPQTGATATVASGEFISAIVAAADGAILVARQESLAWIDFANPTAMRTHVAGRFEGPPNRCNDGKCDPAGRLWLGSRHIDGQARTGTLFCVHPNGRVERKLEGLGCPNGPAWAPDRRTFYLVDSDQRCLDTFTFDVESGSLRERRRLFEFAGVLGVPDGTCVDAEGFLWIALHGGGQVIRFDPVRRRIVGAIETPTSGVTACALGGADRRDLLITTARAGLNSRELAREPLAGGLFKARVDVPGLPAFRFAGSAG